MVLIALLGCAVPTLTGSPSAVCLCAVPGSKAKPKMTVREAVSFLAASHQIRCLALMALAQGISTNLIDVRPAVGLPTSKGARLCGCDARLH